MSTEEKKEKILFQFVMHYKAYRRRTVAVRSAATAVVAGGAFSLCALDVLLGIIIGIAVLAVGAIAVLVTLGYEESYTVYDTRVVLKKRGRDKRVSLPFERVTAVSYKRAFYEKDLATGTVTLTARTEKNKLKKYKLKNIFDAKPAVEYIADKLKTKETE